LKRVLTGFGIKHLDGIDKTLDQMVDHLLAHNEIAFQDLVQFIWRRGWLLVLVSEPQDTDPLRRALKACLVERMVELWSGPPKNSPESIPSWCEAVPPVIEHFSVIKPNDQAFWSSEPANEIFNKRNIFAPKEFMYFL
jgi:hypothetical protein